MLEGLAIAGLGILLFVLSFLVELFDIGKLTKAVTTFLFLIGVVLIFIGLAVQGFQLVINFIITNWYIVLPIVLIVSYLVYKSKFKGLKLLHR